jgi:porin-like protein
MKRLTLLLVAVALLWPAAANAQLTMQMSNGWTFAFAGNVNVFWVFSKVNNDGPANSSVRTGLLPTFATFDAKGREGRYNLGVHFGFAPQINNAGVHDQFGAQIDMRQVYLTIGGTWGTILAGRELGLFSRQNIVNDMTLFGVGAVGIGGGQGGGTTLGRIGYGYLYPNFNAQLTYTTRSGRPAQLSIGLFQPSVLDTLGVYVITKIPRVEAEVTYNKKSGRNTFLLWAGGLWQSTSDSPVDPIETVSSVGGTGGVKADISDLSVVVTGYIGKGLGTTLMFSPTAGGPVAANGTDLRKSDGGYVQLGYAFNRKKTTLAGSWGFSRLVNDETGDGDTAVRSNLYAYTVGIYHQWTKSLKLVFEGTQEGTTGQIGGLTPGTKQMNVSGGFMLFF